MAGKRIPGWQRFSAVEDLEKIAYNAQAFSEVRDVKKRIFLLALSESPNRTRAAALAGVHPTTAKNWMNNDPVFMAAYEVAWQSGLDALEDEVVRRGQEGTTRPVFFKGQKVGSIREYSDGQVQFMLRGHRSETYRDRQELNVTNDQTVADRLSAARRRKVEHEVEAAEQNQKALGPPGQKSLPGAES